MDIDEMTLDKAIENVVEKAMAFAYWTDNGTRRDGNLGRATAELAAAKTALKKFVRGN